jgi:hypothetical protein
LGVRHLRGKSSRFIEQEMVTVPQAEVGQSAATQRQAVRAMLRLLRQERKSDQSYDDEED